MRGPIRVQSPRLYGNPYYAGIVPLPELPRLTIMFSSRALDTSCESSIAFSPTTRSFLSTGGKVGSRILNADLSDRLRTLSAVVNQA